MKKIAIITILLFFVQLINFPLFAAEEPLKKGIKYFNDARFKQAIDTLEKALTEDLHKEDKIQANLFIALAEIALNERNKAIANFKNILLLEPQYVLDRDEYPPDILNLFNETKNSFPIVTHFSIFPAEFFPYNGDQPFFTFHLNANDIVNADIDGIGKTINENGREILSSSEPRIQWTWSDDLLKRSQIDIVLKPQKNGNQYSFKKTIKLQSIMPNNLIYNGTDFVIPGQDFLPESVLKTKSTYFSGYLYCITFAGLGTWGAIAGLSSPKAGNIVLGALSGLFAFAFYYAMFAKKDKNDGGEFFKTKVVSIKKEENIEKNRILREEIETLKKKISVKQKVEEEKNINKKRQQ